MEGGCPGEGVSIWAGLGRVGAGYLLGPREGMVETGHIGHDGFLIWTSCVHNVCRETQLHTDREDAHTYTHTHTHTAHTHTGQLFT